MSLPFIAAKQSRVIVPVAANITVALNPGPLTLTLPSVRVAGDYPFGFGKIFPAGSYKIEYVNGALTTAGIGNDWAVYWFDPAFGNPYNGCYFSNVDGDVFFTVPALPTVLFASQADAEAYYAGAQVAFTTSAPGQIRLRFFDLPYFDNADGDPNPTFKLTRTA